MGKNPYGFWNEGRDGILVDNYGSLSQGELEELLGTNWEAIKIRAWRLGLKRVNRGERGFWSEEKKDFLCEWFSLISCKELGECLGISDRAVSAQATRLCLRTPRTRSEVGLEASASSDSVDIDYFRRSWSRNLAYVLGFTWADGNIGCARPPTNLPRVLSYTLHIQDDSIILNIREELKSIHNVLYTDPWIDRKGVYHGPRVRCAITNVNLIQPLYEVFGIMPRKSYINPPYKSVPDEFLGDFTRGVLDGDGSVGIRERNDNFGWVALNGSHLFIEGLQDHVCRVTGLPKNKIGTDGMLSRCSWYDIKNLYRLYGFMYAPGESLCGVRKKVILEGILGI